MGLKYPEKPLRLMHILSGGSFRGAFTDHIVQFLMGKTEKGKSQYSLAPLREKLHGLEVSKATALDAVDSTGISESDCERPDLDSTDEQADRASLLFGQYLREEGE